jgi:hypothetical protein
MTTNSAADAIRTTLSPASRPTAHLRRSFSTAMRPTQKIWLMTRTLTAVIIALAAGACGNYRPGGRISEPRLSVLVSRSA